MKIFRIYNNLTGWIVFLIAALVYLSTIEPTSSLWDCGEFIASAYKLEVGHPPGAPLFMLAARFFSLLAGNNVEKVAMMINSMSALASALTIMFLFWTITHLAKKILVKDNNLNPGITLAIIGSGLVGALAYTFSDTFWFSAVEGEVYASSSLFTAVVFWAILKWENVADEKYANRWLVFIAFLMGLSLGVHLLNLLAIPAIVLVYYFRKYNPTPLGIVASLLISGFILLFVQFGIIQYVVEFASFHELLFVNKYGLPYNSGVIIFLGLLIIYIVSGIKATHTEASQSEVFYLVSFAALNFAIGKIVIGLVFNIVFLSVYFITRRDLFKTIVIFYLGLIPGYIVWQLLFSEKDKKELLSKFSNVYNLVLVCFAVILIGYSSYATIIIRSLANPPMDQNNPEHVFSLLSYLNREQYGDRPLIRGQYFNAPVTGTEKSDPVYTQIDGKYKLTNHKLKYVFDNNYTTLFPRMYSSEPDHIDAYIQWAKLNEKDIFEPRLDSNGNVMRDREGNIIYDRARPKQSPSFAQNLRFLFRYQLGHMYFRYFMWNFAGRQNDIQGFGYDQYGFKEISKGNWISGIKFIDEARLGDQDNLPDSLTSNKSRNRYYMLPLLLGLIGFIYHYKNQKKDFWIVMILFVMTGIAIVLYLNQYPNQPRERDYAFAGSFYAFAIWIGLGVIAVTDLLKRSLPLSVSAVISSILCLITVPFIMARENWDDHDRSGRYFARDFAYNYLNSCATNAILFTNGDNDTFPLWYAQEVEGIRTDVRVVNLSYLGADWYIEQMERKVYESDPLPMTLTRDKYRQGKRDIVHIIPRLTGYTDLKQAIDFLADDDPRTKQLPNVNERVDHFPNKRFSIPVDSAKVIGNNTVRPEMADKLLSSVKLEINKRYLTKNHLMVLDFLATNNWERPIYYAITVSSDNYLSLDNYFQVHGLAYRIVPLKAENTTYYRGSIDTKIMFDNMINKFKWGGMDNQDIYLDENVQRMLSNFRNNFATLAEALFEENKKDSARIVLDKCLELMPDKIVRFDVFTISIIESYYKLGEIEKANLITGILSENVCNDLDYYMSLKGKYSNCLLYQKRLALHILSELERISRTYGQEEQRMNLEEKLRTYALGLNFTR